MYGALNPEWGPFGGGARNHQTALEFLQRILLFNEEERLAISSVKRFASVLCHAIKIRYEKQYMPFD